MLKTTAKIEPGMTISDELMDAIVCHNKNIFYYFIFVVVVVCVFVISFCVPLKAITDLKKQHPNRSRLMTWLASTSAVNAKELVAILRFAITLRPMEATTQLPVAMQCLGHFNRLPYFSVHKQTYFNSLFFVFVFLCCFVSLAGFVSISTIQLNGLVVWTGATVS